jgi:hypothetical protein
MTAFASLNKRLRVGRPPTPQDTFNTLDRPAEPALRRVKTGRTEQFNVRVKAGFKERIEELAARDKETLGGMLELMLAAYEAGAGAPQHGIPIAEARAGRTRTLRLWATDQVFSAIGKVAAERKLTVSGLIEDLLAREVQRLDPHGGRFGVDVRR